MNKKPVLSKMTWQVALETMMLISKHLRTYTPLLAALGRRGTRVVRQELLIQFSEALHKDNEAFEDVKRIVGNLLGEAVEDVDFVNLPNLFKEAWRLNKMQDALRVGVALGLIDKTDLARALWVSANWKR